MNDTDYVIENLHIDGQQFHQYQQNEQSFSFDLSEHRKRLRRMRLEIQVLSKMPKHLSAKRYSDREGFAI